MNATQLKIAITAGLFLCIFVFGYWLSHSGKPYNGIIFNIHKLAALGAVVYLAITVYKVHKIMPFSPALMILLAFTAVCLLALFVSGAFLSLDKALPQIVLRLHHIAPYLVLLSTAESFYLLVVKSATQ